MKYEISDFDNRLHREQVVKLWNEVFDYGSDHRVPQLAINKKIEFENDLFFVALNGENVIGTILAGYDGHRGWIYSMAVSPEFQRQGIGTNLLLHAERRLAQLGCMKINLQVLEHNAEVQDFYVSNGYRPEKRISMGKKLPVNIPNSTNDSEVK